MVLSLEKESTASFIISVCCFLFEKIELLFMYKILDQHLENTFLPESCSNVLRTLSKAHKLSFATVK